MYTKKLLTIIISITLFMGLTSCKSFRYEVMNTDYDAVGEARFQQIMDALSNTNNETLKSLFSPNALKEATDIDGGIEYLMNFYKGEMISQDGSTDLSATNEYGAKTVDLISYYTVTTDEDTYTVFFIDKVTDTENPDNVGLYMLQIIKEADRDKYFDWGGDKTRCAGIYRPTEAETESITEPTN